MGVPTGWFLYVVVCGAGPAPYVATMVRLAQARGWNVQVIATPAALDFIDAAALGRQTGFPVRSDYRGHGTGHGAVPLPRADAIIVAPATYNTINKWASGVSDTYALGILAEAPAFGIPIVVLPFVNAALASRRPFRRSLEILRAEGIQVLVGPGEFEPHQPGTGGNLAAVFPWHVALAEVERRLNGGTAASRPSSA
ncbi:MAG TPA: flavoprotein [Streptosporangiaceae bacterium]